MSLKWTFWAFKKFVQVVQIGGKGGGGGFGQNPKEQQLSSVNLPLVNIPCNFSWRLSTVV